MRDGRANVVAGGSAMAAKKESPEPDPTRDITVITKQRGPPVPFNDATTHSGAKNTVSKRKRPDKGIDAYLAALPVDHLSALQKLRKLIKEIVPTATEELTFQVPTFMYHGPLVAYAAGRKHCSFFVRSNVLMKAMQKELMPYFAGPGTLRFTDMEPLPSTLVRAIVKARMQENEAAKSSG